MAIFNRRNKNEERMAQRQSAPQPDAGEEAANMGAMSGDAVDGFKVLSQVIGKEQIHAANLTLQKYKEGKANLERRIIDN